MSDTKRLPFWVPAVVLLAFTVWTATIVYEHGYTGFITLALNDDWGAQVLVDLVIALVIVIGWMIGDARRRTATVWPFVAVTLFLGSIGPLSYLVLRSIQEDRRPDAAS